MELHHLRGTRTSSLLSLQELTPDQVASDIGHSTLSMAETERLSRRQKTNIMKTHRHP